jgi:hypothetical protein
MRLNLLLYRGRPPESGLRPRSVLSGLLIGLSEDRRSVPADAAGHDGDVRDDLTALLSHRTRPAAARTARPSGCWSTSACCYTSSSPYCSSSYLSDTGDHVLDVRTTWVCGSSILLTTASDFTLPGVSFSSADSRPPRRTIATTFRGRWRGFLALAVDTASSFSTYYFRC